MLYYHTARTYVTVGVSVMISEIQNNTCRYTGWYMYHHSSG